MKQLTGKQVQEIREALLAAYGPYETSAEHGADRT